MRCGGLSLELRLQREAESVQVGSGALQAADANRSFLPSLLMPRFYSAVYRWESDLTERDGESTFLFSQKTKNTTRGCTFVVGTISKPIKNSWNGAFVSTNHF